MRQASYRVELIGGRLRLDSQSAAIDQGTGGRDTEGSYQKLALSVSRLQRLDPQQLLLYVALSGQVTTKNLDSSEKQSIGGAYGVRAYSQGEATGDDAAILNLELRWALPELPDVQALVFADVAAVWANDSTLTSDGENHRVLSGEGIGNRTRATAWQPKPVSRSARDHSPPRTRIASRASGCNSLSTSDRIE